MQAGAEKAAGELNVDLTWKGPLKEDDRDEQTKVVENFTAEKLDGIVLAPLDDQALRPPVEEAQAAGIPIIIVDSALQGVKTVSFIATDNFAAGKLGGEKLVKVMGGKGRVILLRYAEGSASTTEREKGFLEAAKAGGLEVVSSEQYGGATRESAQSASENLIARYKKGDALDVEGIFCPNESTTFGMLRALQNANLNGKVKFVGFDSSKELIDGISAGDIEGLVLQNPNKMGYLAVTNMVKSLKKESVPEKIDTGAVVVDKANLDSADVKALLGVK
jgi:ribose transport system substrate-binding protein